jgi:hypothetical protein
MASEIHALELYYTYRLIPVTIACPVLTRQAIYFYQLNSFRNSLNQASIAVSNLKP